MSNREVTPREALMRLGASTAEAIARVLENFAPGKVERGEVSVLAEGTSPFASLPPGTVATSVSYVDGVRGANIFTMTPAGARVLATEMMGIPPEPGRPELELSELELSAVAEAANQMMAAAAGAISVVLGQEVQISPPDTRILERPDQAVEAYGSAPHASSTTFLIAGEPCRLIQLVPSAFVVRLARAIDEMSVEHAAGGAADGGAGRDAETGANGDAGPLGLREALIDINLRVWAELGRTRLPLGRALELPAGAVVDLDRAADAPVDLFVNGLRFAQGHLLITDDGEWAVCLDTIGTPAAPAAPGGASRFATKGAPS